MWNTWADDETLLDLVGHLRGGALEEWNLMDVSDKTDFSKAVDSLRRCLEPGSKTLAAQELQRVSQVQDESIADYIRRLKKMFRMAYGGDKISAETRDALLFSQMQEGLKYELMVSLAVLGATEYSRELLSTDSYASLHKTKRSDYFSWRSGASSLGCSLQLPC
jgi:hypothetical protein